MEPKDAERLAELLDTRVVEVTDDNNELTMNLVDLDTPKKKDKKNKKSKNESRISGFGDFKRH